jgi:uncharacterized protein YicC (UPF0701 family)
MTASEIVAVAVQSALRAKDGRTSDSDLDATDWEAMFLAQCEATDEWAKRARDAEHAKAPDTLRKRIDDLEKDLATVNRRLSAMNEGEKAVLLEAAEAARRALDDCTHPDCIEDRRRKGYSSCAGGHIARRVVKAIRGEA